MLDTFQSPNTIIPTEIENFKKGISERFKFRDEGRLKKHLGVTYEWKLHQKTGKSYIEATMRTLIDEIIKKYQQVMEREPKEYSTPAKPNEHLKKGAEEEENFKAKEYRSLAGKYMYLVTKISPRKSKCCKRFNEIFFLPNKRSLESGRKSNRTLKENKGYNQNHFQ